MARTTPAADMLYGLTSADAAGRTLAELIQGVEAPLPWPERLASGTWRGREAHRAAGGRVWVEARVASGPEGPELRARRLRHVEILQEQGRLWTTLAESLAVGGVGVFVDDTPNNLIECSPETQRLFGLSSAEVTHAALFSRMHPEDAPRIAAEIQRHVAEKIESFRFRLRIGSPEEGWREAEAFGVVPQEDEIDLGAIGCIREATSTRRLEERIAHLEAELRQAQKMDIVGRLTGGIAHDFNNLLTVIVGSAQLLERSAGLSDRPELSAIYQAVQRAGDMTQQLLAFGRRQSLRPRVVGFDVAVAEAHRMLRRLLGDHIATSLTLGAGEARVLINPVHIHQILSNLMINASQALGERAGEIRVTTSSAVLDGDPERQGPFVCLEVSDTGPGIPPAVLPLLFEPFFTTKPVGSGTGLGLSTLRGIAEEQGGFVTAESPEGGGAVFRVYLRRTERPLETLDAAPPDPAPAGGGETILLAEDSPLVRELAQQILEDAGYTVWTAEDGAVALERAEQGPFDLLLTDVIMPARTGTSLADELRARGLDVPVLFMSGYPADLIERRVHLGPHDRLLRKPFTSDQLLREIESSLRT